MVVTLNGEPREVTSATVDALLGELGYEGAFLAIAVNEEVVRRAAWASRRIVDGDRVEIVTPRQGG